MNDTESEAKQETEGRGEGEFSEGLLDELRV